MGFFVFYLALSRHCYQTLRTMTTTTTTTKSTWCFVYSLSFESGVGGDALASAAGSHCFARFAIGAKAKRKRQLFFFFLSFFLYLGLGGNKREIIELGHDLPMNGRSFFFCFCFSIMRPPPLNVACVHKYLSTLPCRTVPYPILRTTIKDVNKQK